jgi:hypothetical protein
MNSEQHFEGLDFAERTARAKAALMAQRGISAATAAERLGVWQEQFDAVEDAARRERERLAARDAESRRIIDILEEE